MMVVLEVGEIVALVGVERFLLMLLMLLLGVLLVGWEVFRPWEGEAEDEGVVWWFWLCCMLWLGLLLFLDRHSFDEVAIWSKFLCFVES